jgi:peptidyl-prolyl cis-trans isomerase SurA
VVPRGSPQSAFETRRKEAEAFRGQFKNCELGIPYARSLAYVAVRPPVTKSSSELPPALREILEKTELGGVTAPEVTTQGVEVHALCGKRQSDIDNAPAKREAREEVFKERFESHSARFLKELRSQAMIEFR